MAEPMLPVFSWVIETVDDHFRVEHLDIADGRIELKAIPVRPLVLGKRILMPDTGLRFAPSALVGSVLQPLILLVAIVLSWPIGSLASLTKRLLLMIPAIPGLLVINVPLGFIGAMLDFRQYFPDMAVEPLVYWNDFLQADGALVLAVSAAIVTLSVAEQGIVAASPSRSASGRPAWFKRLISLPSN